MTANKTTKSNSKRRRRKKAAAPPPPAYFLGLTVKDVRCFGPEQSLDLSDGKGRPARWTVILGDNGTGKTTLLQCLAALEPSIDQHFQVDEPHIRPIGAINPRKSSDFNRARDEFFRLVATIAYGTRLTDRPQRYHRGVISFESMEKSRSSVDLDFRRREGGYWPTPKKVDGLVCYGYGSARRIGVGALSDERSSDYTASLYSEEIALLNAEEWLLQADYAASKRSPISSSAKTRTKQIKEVLTGILPDVSDIRFLVPQVVQDKPRVEFKTPYGWVPIRKLGLGYQTMIAWTVDLARRLFHRYPDSADPLGEPAVVLVDEIDLHLHPRWQRKIMSYLSERFVNTQFIVTAHSPLIVQAATDANLAVLRREGDHVVIDQSIKAVHGWRVDQVLTSDLFGLETARSQEFEEILRARQRILSKRRPTKQDKKELKALEATIENLPLGETREDIEAMDFVRRATRQLKKAGNKAQ